MQTTLETLDSSLVAEMTPEPPGFSLVSGGPLFQLFRRSHLSGDALELPFRRVLAIALLVWLPLLFLSVLQRHAIGGSIKIPFLHDVEANVRFLVALPVLIFAELLVQQRISPLVRRLVERGVVVTKDSPKLNAAVISAIRARDSIAVEGTLLVLVYALGLWAWRSQIALGEPTWYATPAGKQLNLALAGYWYVFVSIPVFQFILLRWYVRLTIWFRLLWQISRLNLHLSAAHPDRSGGIGFIGKSSYAFAPLLFAQGVVLSGLIASRVLYDGQPLVSFKMEAAGFVVFFVSVILGPLVMFTPQLSRAQRKGSSQYSLLASTNVFLFEDKWIQGCNPEPGKLLAADIQAIAALENVCSSVRQMRVIPFGTDDITRLAVTAAAPLLPLALTIFSVPQLLKFLVKIVFK